MFVTREHRHVIYCHATLHIRRHAHCFIDEFDASCYDLRHIRADEMLRIGLRLLRCRDAIQEAAAGDTKALLRWRVAMAL